MLDCITAEFVVAACRPQFTQRNSSRHDCSSIDVTLVKEVFVDTIITVNIVNRNSGNECEFG